MRGKRNMDIHIFSFLFFKFQNKIENHKTQMFSWICLRGVFMSSRLFPVMRKLSNQESLLFHQLDNVLILHDMVFSHLLGVVFH